GDLRRPSQVEDDSRTSGHDEPITERLDQAASVRAGADRQLEADLRDIDDDAIGIVQRESSKLDGLVEIEDEASLLGVAREPRIGRDWKTGGDDLGLGGRWRLAVRGAYHREVRTRQCRSAQRRTSQQNMAICAVSHRIRPSERLF